MPTGEGLQREASGMSRGPPKALPDAHVGPHQSSHLALSAGSRDRLEYSRSVSGMELVMEELVEVMVLREGLTPYAGKVPVMAAV